MALRCSRSQKQQGWKEGRFFRRGNFAPRVAFGYNEEVGTRLKHLVFPLWTLRQVSFQEKKKRKKNMVICSFVLYPRQTAKNSWLQPLVLMCRSEWVNEQPNPRVSSLVSSAFPVSAGPTTDRRRRALSGWKTSWKIQHLKGGPWMSSRLPHSNPIFFFLLHCCLNRLLVEPTPFVGSPFTHSWVSKLWLTQKWKWAPSPLMCWTCTCIVYYIIFLAWTRIKSSFFFF